MPKKKSGISRRTFLKWGPLAYGALAVGRVPKATSKTTSKKRPPVKSSAVKPPNYKPKNPYIYNGKFRSNWYGKNGLLKRYPKVNPDTLGGRRCIEVADRAALTANEINKNIGPKYVIECLKTHGVSTQALRRISREAAEINKAQAGKNRSTDAAKRRDDKQTARIKKLELDYAIIRALVEADIACDGLEPNSNGIVPPSGRELASAVGGGSILGGLKKFFSGGKKQQQAIGSPSRRARTSAKQFMELEPNPERVQAAGSARVRNSKSAVPEQISRSSTSLASGKQWDKIFKAYPGWQRARNQPRFARNAEGAIILVSNVATATGTSPANVIAVRKKYVLSRHTLPKYKNISATELKIFNALLKEKKSNKQAFDYMMRATRSWFSSN